jgi:hypothetical protein
MKETRKPEGSELRKELNQLWQSTIDQFDEIKNAIVRSSQAGKARLDAQFLKRQRERLLTKLGEDVLAAEARGELQLPDACAETARRVHELEEQIRAEEAEAARLIHQQGVDASSEETPPSSPEPGARTE